MSHKSKAQIQKEFNEFAEKIARLESLKHELDALDAKGFETDVKLIKVKLKDINAIDSITKDISILKGKIERKKSASEVPVSGLKKRISHLEHLIENKRKLIGKGQLSRVEIKDVKDIPKLERELNSLRNSVRQHFETNKVKIDSGVGVLVDSKFDDFVYALKAELTQKLKEEEHGLKTKEELDLKADLDRIKELFAEKEFEEESKVKSQLNEKKQIFNQKVRELVKKYHEMYQNKINDELEREVKRKFNERLNEKVGLIKSRVIEDTKKKVLGGIMRENAKKLSMVTKKTARKLKETTEDKMNRLKAKMHNEMVSQVQGAVKKKELELRKSLDREYREKLNNQMKVKQVELEKKKAKLEAFVAIQARKLFK